MASREKSVPMTLPDSAPLEELGVPWRLLYTKPRQEKALASELSDRGIPYFLPLLARVSDGGVRRRTYLNPLFPSYVFAAINDHQLVAVKDSPRVLECLSLFGAEQEAFCAEIAALEAVLRQCPGECSEATPPFPGELVRVSEGVLAGLTGVSRTSNEKVRVWFGVSAVNSGVEIEMDPESVEPLA